MNPYDRLIPNGNEYAVEVPNGYSDVHNGYNIIRIDGRTYLVRRI